MPQQETVNGPAVPGVTHGLSIIIPCYNEEQGIAPVLDQLDATLRRAGLPYEIIVVDDGSADATASRVDPARFQLLRHEVNEGYGAALKTGARASRYDLIGITDGDGTYPNERIPDLLAQMGGADMVVGARIGDQVEIPLVRRPAKWVLNRLANYLTGYRIPDLNSGLRIARRSLWERYEYLYPDGFSLTTTITLAALTNHCRVRYVPINYHHRVGHSKIRPIRNTLDFTQLILRTILYFNPMKVFLPASLMLFAASLLIGFTTLVLANVFKIGKFMDTTTVLLFMTAVQLLAIGVLADLITKRMK